MAATTGRRAFARNVEILLIFLGCFSHIKIAIINIRPFFFKFQVINLQPKNFLCLLKKPVSSARELDYMFPPVLTNMPLCFS